MKVESMGWRWQIDVAFIQANLVNMLKGLEMAELFTLMSLIDVYIALSSYA